MGSALQLASAKVMRRAGATQQREKKTITLGNLDKIIIQCPALETIERTNSLASSLSYGQLRF